MSTAVGYSSIPEVNHSLQKKEAKTKTSSSTITTQILQYEWRIFLATFAFGLLALSIYMISFYVRSILNNNLAAWDITFKGMYHENNSSNIGLAVHFIGASYFVLFAPLQYIPSFRRRYTTLHIWNGRIALLLLSITALGGIYYVMKVGISQMPEEYQFSADLAMYVFGISTLLCCVMMYYYAAISKPKRIDLHKLWAYRLAGLIFGSQMYFRLIFIVEGAITGTKALESNIGMVSTMFVLWTFVLPFLLLGDIVYKMQTKAEEEVEEDSLLHKQNNGETKQLLDYDDDVVVDYSNQHQNENATSWKEIGTVLTYGILIVIFISTLIIWTIYSWLPYCTVNQRTGELPSWAKGSYDL